MPKEENNYFFQKDYEIYFQTGMEIKVLGVIRKHFEVKQMENDGTIVLIISSSSNPEPKG